LPNSTTWIDSTIGRSYNTVYYRLYAYYETYCSDSTETNSNITFPAPSNFEFEILSPSSVKLTWKDNSIGEQGFKIDKKVGDSVWQIDFSIVGDNTEEWVDGNAEILNDTIQYRLYAYYENYTSDYSLNVVIHPVLFDIDGNIYQIISIGNQCWMAENLRLTHYSNGDTIPNVTANNIWSGLNTGAYCCYDNNVENVATYGCLYNWYSVNDNRGLAPEGWHVPTDDDWQELVDYLGGCDVSGGKMKETGEAYWNSPNTGATNESGFSALPGGYRQSDNGYFHCISNYALFLSSTELGISNAWCRKLSYNNSGVNRYSYSKGSGFSIRCIRD